MVPGPSDAPTAGAKTCSVPFGVRSGAALAETCPVIKAVTGAKPGAVAVAAMVTCEAVDRGVHVAEKTPDDKSTGLRDRGGSPFENVATTCPMFTNPPQ